MDVEGESRHAKMLVQRAMMAMLVNATLPSGAGNGRTRRSRKIS